jgi:ABC-2 type transport system permease protein
MTMATIAPPRNGIARPQSSVGTPPRLRIFRALWGRSLRDIRGRTIAFAYVFAAVAYINPVSYRHAYPTLAERIAFAHSFGHNKAVVLFYGKAYDLLTIGGYTAWRSGGILAIFAAVFGLMAAVRLIRTGEESGQTELVLSGLATRRLAGLAVTSSIATATAVLWLATVLGLVAAGLPLSGSAYLALVVACVIPVFAGLGAVVSQLASSRRFALELGLGAVAVFFLLRLIADTATGAGWLDWITPLGWAERLRAFTGAQPLVLVLPGVISILLVALSARLQAGRDIGTGLLTGRSSARPHLVLLSSPTGQALRQERSSLIAWLAGIGVFALVVGVISKSVSSVGISKQLSRELAKLGAGTVLRPVGYISFTFIFFVFVVSLFAASQVAATRHAEADGQLETVLSQPVARWRWLTGRLLLGLAAVVALSLAAVAATWLGAVSQGVSLPAGRMLEAGANCLPTAVLFLGLGALGYAVIPRAASELAYGLVIVAFLWQLFGSLLGAPRWLVDATPFVHLGLAPIHAFRPGPAAVMLLIGIAAGTAAVARFGQRDVISA